MNSGSEYSSTHTQSQSRSAGANLTDTVVDTLVRWPMRVTEATMDYMLEGVQRMTGSAGSDGSSSSDSGAPSSSNTSASGSGWTSMFSGQTSGTVDQDLSGNDLKYVIWSIVFTKPGHETILQTQQEELVNYSADPNTYAATKIARLVDGARHGRVAKPEAWTNYPSETKTKVSRSENKAGGSESSTTTTTSATAGGSKASSEGEHDRGWRVPPEDQKYITFLYHVDRRLPKQQEVRRVEHVTVERDTRIV